MYIFFETYKIHTTNTDLMRYNLGYIIFESFAKNSQKTCWSAKKSPLSINLKGL